MKAISDDWKAPKAMEPPKRQKATTVPVDPVQEISDERREESKEREMASLKAKVKELLT